MEYRHIAPLTAMQLPLPHTIVKTPAAVQISANVNNMAVRLDALRELLPSSLGDVPLRSQLAGLGILSEVQVLYQTLEIHTAEMEVKLPLGAAACCL